MANDSQNKMPSRPDNVVSLSRHELVADVEKKLVEARRFFSLHDYRACEELVLAVLAVDPHNAKAKALLDLASIKLSRRKLYKKMVDPAAASSPDATIPPGQQEAHPPLQSWKPDAPEPLAESAGGLPIPEGEPVSTRRDTPQRHHPSPPPVAPSDAPLDNMRERTIAAMVDLLKNKGKSLQDWRSEKPAASSRLDASMEAGTQTHPASVPDPAQKGSTVADTKAPPVPAATWPAAPVLPDKSEFIAGSLADLFEPGSAKPAPPAPPPATRTPAPPPPVQAPGPPQPEPHASSTQPSEAPVLDAKQEPKPERVEEPARQVPRVSVPPPAPPAAESPKVVHLPDVRPFDQITPPRKVGYQEVVEQKLGERSEEIRNSEVRTVSIAQIKKYLYQEEYDLCSRELERIRVLFPQNAEIQAFVENTSKRLVELKRIKAFERQAKELMASAVMFYQEGKLEEALIAAGEILRVNPNHVQAKEFVNFVERRQSRDRKKEFVVEKIRFCKACGTTVDAVSQFCFHCGKRLTP